MALGFIEKIRFFRTIYEPDGMGGSNAIQFTIWEPQGAQIKEMKPNPELIATQENLSQVIRIKCRYNPEISIRLGDKVEWRGFIFNTLLPTVDRRTRMMEIMAFSEIETTDRENDSSTEIINWDGGSPDTEFVNDIDGGIL